MNAEYMGTRGHHVCVVVKALSDWELDVEVKCSNETLGSALLKETQDAFRLGSEKKADAAELDFLAL
eukprot:NODE_7471_length_399_cov_110.777143_g5253_i2.p3 GENE.NODE_7471_length_399_cov_110.777143_g5253_i2~~NODE_7471_length_399_cov_110.777143_g5253_i2.p3  ORF type:complete len:67 (+),score=37.21 NODE_7471_length_399_cov_110.777143_g5253_i2:2-202(+)